MGLGVLDDHVLEQVPGTVDLVEDERRRLELARTQTYIKKDKTGRIILVPQPSDDPNDPLNWSLRKRDGILLVLCFAAAIASVATPQLAAISITILTDTYHGSISYQDIALLTGWHLCGLAVGGILFVASARVWGKRHLFILGSILTIVSSAWAGASGSNYASLVWARVIQGVALAPFEALVNAVVGDLYFVHERGPRMAFTNVTLFGAAFLSPVFIGKITASLGWEWSFYFIAIFSGVAFPLLFCLVPETAFNRPFYLNIDLDDKEFNGRPRNSTSTERSTVPLDSAHESSEGFADKETNGVRRTASTMRHVDSMRPPKKPWIQTLRPFSGRYTSESFFKLFLRPFPLFLHPAVLWAALIQGVIIGWLVLVGVILAFVFQTPPTLFDEVQVGYLYTGPFIGSIVGLVLSGLLADLINRAMIRLNHGKYEPEFRLLLIVPMAIFSGAGLYGFGITANNTIRYGWLVPTAFFMLCTVGMVIGAVAAALYIVDAHRDIAVEAFTCLLIFKNLFSFVLTWYAFDWIFKVKKDHLFIILASVEMGICALSIPMYVLGKKNRSFFHRHDILRILGLRSAANSSEEGLFVSR